MNAVEIDRELDAYREGEWDDPDADIELALIATIGEQAWVEAPSDDDAMAALAEINQCWQWWTTNRVTL